MSRRFLNHLLVQLILVVVVAATAGLGAFILMGAVGGTAMGVAPEFSFGLVEDIVCPEGTLEYYPIQRGYHEPGESEPHVECVSLEGEREDVLLPAIGAVLGMTFTAAFVASFLLLWIPLAVVGWLVTRRVTTRRQLAVGLTEE